MSGDVDHEAPTSAGPTQIGPQIEQQWAYSQVTDVIDYRPVSNVKVGLIAAGITATAALIVGALFVVNQHHHVVTVPIAVPTPLPESAPAAAPVTPIPLPAVSPTPHLQPAVPTELTSQAGSVFVRTQSGKTVCQVTAGNVACNVRFTRAVPNVDGLPASGVGVTSRGSWQWLVGDPGDPDYNTLSYGMVYRALGWKITPTSAGTTFMNDQTGHGMTISTDGFSTF